MQQYILMVHNRIKKIQVRKSMSQGNVAHDIIEPIWQTERHRSLVITHEYLDLEKLMHHRFITLAAGEVPVFDLEIISGQHDLFRTGLQNCALHQYQAHLIPFGNILSR